MIGKILKRAGLGFLLGVAVNSLIKALTYETDPVTLILLERIGSLRSAMLLELVLVGLYGAICMAGTLLYDADRLPLSLATLLHCLMCILPFAPLALFLGWCTRLGDVLIMSGFQLVAFFLIWLILYVSYRREIRELNKMQKDYLNENGEETGGTL